MKNVVIELTKAEWSILRKHFSQDISYGYAGTFGDGENYNSRAEYTKAKEILYKLEKAGGLMA